MFKGLTGFFSCLLLWPAVAAESRFEFWPGARYDSRTPTYKQVLGHDPGDRIVPHASVVKFLEALAASSPRIKIFDYGKTWEGRRLVYAAVGSEANIRRLDEIRAAMAQLADPRRTPEPEAKRLMASLPAVIWLSYGVHGNEISSPEAALLTAYHLIASRGDKMVDDILGKTLVLIAPLQNPDGRDRFVHNFEQAEGIEPDAHPLAAEHIEPWPGGRSNHYLFDMNRDWFALTQPEIREQARALLEWFPLVYVDLHEMGSDSTYYFSPEAHPYNPHLVADQKDSLYWFGKNNAKWFDKFGFDYFTREVFDAFYPGYGASWPLFHGAVATTYEQASARGLAMRRSDDSVFRFRDTIRQHFVASIATCETAAVNRAKLLEQFYRFRKTAIEEGGSEPVKEYVLVRAGDTAAVDKLAGLLVEQGIEVRRALAPFKAGGREFPAGSYAVSMAQPAKRLVRTLLDPDVPMDEKFLKEQNRLRDKRLPDEIYDVTSWSVPLSFNVEAAASKEAIQGQFEPARPVRIPPGRVMDGEASVAYLVPWNTAAARLLAAALRRDLRVLSPEKAFTQNGRSYPKGTLVFKVNENPANLREILADLARTTGADVYPTSTSWVDDGVNFGSRHVARIRRPVIALAWDRPTSSASAGWARFVIERQFGYPVTPVRTSLLASAGLSKFDALVFPDGSAGGYASTLGAAGVRRLKEWVAAGGTVIGIGDAMSFLSDPKTGLLSVSQEYAAAPPEPGKKPEAAEQKKPASAEPAARVPGKLLATEEEYQKAIRAESELPGAVLGALLRARLDPDHWITAGLGQTVNALYTGRTIYTPVKLDKGVNAALFEGPEKLVASGFVWQDAKKQLAYKPMLVIQNQGRGYAVGFAADPNFRAYTDGMNLLFINALFRAPAHARNGGE